MAVKSSSDVRRHNRAMLLRHLVFRGAASRTDLATLYDLSYATASNVINELKREGVVREESTLASGGGRPVTVLEVAPDSTYFIGLDVGETGVTAELVDLGLQISGRASAEFMDGEFSASAVRAAIAEAISDLKLDSSVTSKIYGLGLGLPGIVKYDESRYVDDSDATFYTENLDWQPIKVSDLVPDGYRVFVDNGATTLAMMEKWMGDAADDDHVVIALIGRGVGAGVINDGRVLRGKMGSAVEWGHWAIRCEDTNRESSFPVTLESVIGGDAAVAAWEESCGQVFSDKATALDDLIDNALHNNDAARNVLDGVINHLAMGLSNLVNIFNPTKIIIGGWAGTKYAQHFDKVISEHIERSAVPIYADSLTVKPATFGEDSVALGSALLAVKAFTDHIKDFA